MIYCTPVPQHAWLGILDDAKLDYWRRVKQRIDVKVALERLQLGAPWPPWLEALAHDAFRRVARRQALLSWHEGPGHFPRARRAWGFWPAQMRLLTALRLGECLIAPEQWIRGRARLGPEQRYWLMMGEGFARLCAHNEKPLWEVREPYLWRILGTPGEPLPDEPLGEHPLVKQQRLFHAKRAVSHARQMFKIRQEITRLQDALERMKDELHATLPQAKG